MRTANGGRHTASSAVRARTGLLLVAGALIVSGCVSGCASTPDPVPSETSTTAAPVFASDEEALAAATEAYAAYLAANEMAWSDDASRHVYLELSTSDAHDADLDAFDRFDDKGWRKIGSAGFDSMRVQSVNPDGNDRFEIRTYLCLDVRGTDVVDLNGKSVVKLDRPQRLPLVVAFVTKAPRSRDLLISESKSWAGTNFC